MAEVLTPQQRQAVWNRGGKLLVSAAAGSGKTKVLVDRLMSYLTDPVSAADLDDFLIITYTKAAASELRGKIAAKLSERIALDPGNRHLQQQMQRLYLTKISTVHAFCTDLLREYAYVADIPADFRVADEYECTDIQAQVMEQLLEDSYAQLADDPDFQSFVNSQGLGRDDRLIPEIILQVYNSARCHLDPEMWLQWCQNSVNVETIPDASETLWGAWLIQDMRNHARAHIDALNTCIHFAGISGGMEKPIALLRSTVEQLQILAEAETWDEIAAHREVSYGKMLFSKKCDPEVAERIKAVRNACKEDMGKILRSFSSDSAQVLEDLSGAASASRGLIAIVRAFAARYSQKKLQRRVMDFSDLEHRTLDLLIGKKRSGPTALAREIGERYREVMVDEYQDSNGVQDAIFNALTIKRQNCFMVGDVKQSIYQFRLADPDIFIQKYNHYAHADNCAPGEGRKVLLSSNFRSSGGVIQGVNDVFANCMSPEVGGIVYTDEEMLREGIPHTPLPEPEVSLYAIDVREDTYGEEAAFVAQQIRQMLDGTHMVREGEALRPARAEDIVILLRSHKSVAGEFAYALEQQGIACTMGSSMGLLETEEVSTLRSFLQVISNPLQDIPLVALLMSRLFCFTADEMAAIRGISRRKSIFQMLRRQTDQKSIRFLETLQQLRQDARMLSLSQLIQKIFTVTAIDSIYAAMPDGPVRKRNLQHFCQLASDFESSGRRDLDQFLDHIAALEEKGQIEISGNQADNAVTIMSIHKSKGLEFPVVFLCGLSRRFNKEVLREKVLCHKELGLGLSCVDTKNRVRYPTIAKKAIASKIICDSISEEMRVLYVAMTRARDRLVMTYAAKNIHRDLADIALRWDYSPKYLMTSQVNCPGEWVLQTAMQKIEAGELFAVAGKPDRVFFQEPIWNIRLVTAPEIAEKAVAGQVHDIALPTELLRQLQESLAFAYPHRSATTAPSKLTATQLKGRLKDMEAAENTFSIHPGIFPFRSPAVTEGSMSAVEKGNALHMVMQYIHYENCGDAEGVNGEIQRLLRETRITQEQADAVDPEMIAALFRTDVGKLLCSNHTVLREFKFSILEDSSIFDPALCGEKVLIQGVIDCAVLEPDGITVIDFKSDHATEASAAQLVEKYSGQVCTYANALSKIYRMPIKKKYLYLFELNQFVEI